MSEIIKYNIENCNIISKNHIRVSGWVFSESSNECIKIFLEYKNNMNYNINFYERQDVKNKYKNFKGSLKSGFTIDIYNINSFNLRIKFVDDLNNNSIYILHVIKVLFEYKIKKFFKFLKKFSINNIKKFISNIRIYGYEIAFRKAKEKLFSDNESNKDNIYSYYNFNDINVPKEWIDLQKFKPKICIIIPVNNVKQRGKLLVESLNSIQSQTYENWEVYICISAYEVTHLNKFLGNYLNNKKLNIKTIESNSTKDRYIEAAFKSTNSEYFCILEQEDLLTKNALAHFIEEINQNKNLKVIYSDEDRFYEKNKFFNPIIKSAVELKDCSIEFILKSCLIHRNSLEKVYEKNFYYSLKKLIKDLRKMNIKYVDKVLYHSRVISNVWKDQNKVKAIAFYLPQYHEIPENDRWWGKGFTEWTNVKRAKPLFEGHNQRREPGDLGYYNLVKDKNIQEEQIKLAKKYNIYGFCYYYYWFNGKKLLDKPLKQVLSNSKLDLPFCICWANENWTRRWDGLQNEILIEQIHKEDTDKNFIRDIIPIIKDSRYIRINGAPLILIYKIELIKKPKETINVWRNECKNNGVDKIHIAIVKQSDESNPLIYGADSMVEFPPHCVKTLNITNKVKNLVKNFNGGIYDYEYTANNQINMIKENYTFYRGCMLEWDNTARRLNSASIFHNFSITNYKKWLLKCIDYEKLFNNPEKRYVFINAWNEWAEGAYLEPDQKYGYKCLEATKEIINSK